MSSDLSDEEIRDIIRNRSQAEIDADIEAVGAALNTFDEDLRRLRNSACFHNRSMDQSTSDVSALDQSVAIVETIPVIDITELTELQPPPVSRRRALNDSPSEIVDLCSPVTDRRRARNNRRRSNNAANSPDTIESVGVVDLVEDDSPRTGVAAVERGADANLVAARLQCSVCLECALQNSPTTTKCGHVFCYSCITKWVAVRKSCPLCNAKLNAKNLVRMYV